MTQIVDVSPTWSNTNITSPGQSVSGRMLSLACAQDGETVFAGSLSNDIWASEDGGRTWGQVVWPQPAAGQFGVPGAMGGFCVTDVAVSPDSGRWLVERDLRVLADIRGIGREDIVGFGATGVWTALSNGDGTFQKTRVVLANFGYEAGEWRVEKHPRFLADLTGNGLADIVGFGDAGVWTALSNGDGTFQDAKFVLANFGYNAGEWRVEKHPRFLADLTGNSRADIVGFGDAGVWTALSNGDGTFQDAKFVLANFGYNAGEWRVEKHPRFLADIRGNGLADIVGFGDAGVWIALSNGDGTFPEARFVLANFGYQLTVLAITRSHRLTRDSGIWRSTDGGANWAPVHLFPLVDVWDPPAGQLVWAPGSGNLVYAAGGTALAISRDGGATFENVLLAPPVVRGPAGPAALPASPGSALPPLPIARQYEKINHVAVAPSLPGMLAPPAVYALGDSFVFVSFDGGGNWTQDLGGIPPKVGGAVGLDNSQAASVLVVSPRSPLEVFLVGNANQSPPKLFRGDYTQFDSTQQSIWNPIVLPNLGSQDSGNVFLAATQQGQGDLLFLGGQRSKVNVGPLAPVSSSDWRQLDDGGSVHVDLHGIFLSPDFSATLQGGNYQVNAGTVWILSDGGIDWSADGGQHFQPAQNIKTLSCVNVAGVAINGQGPALSLNTGDNDGFYSMDGGAHWTSQDYGGGDNDCSFADPLRPHSMLVFTPRWNHTVTVYETVPGQLPDGRKGTNLRHTVPGPPKAGSGADIWNATSQFGNMGSKPIVRNLPGDDTSAPGDYIFIRFRANETVLLRTQNILAIASSSEWETTATSANQGANVFQQGPALPALNVCLAQASGGHTGTVFYAGNQGLLWKWTEGMANWQMIVQGGGAWSAWRFFVDPYQRNLIYVLDGSQGKILRSDDGGFTWQVDQSLQTMLSCGGLIPVWTFQDESGQGDHFDVVLTDMGFDPFHPLRRFAVGAAGAFCTNDGVNWVRLLDTAALPGRPANCYYDWISNPSDPALYVSFAGRSLVKINQLP